MRTQHQLNPHQLAKNLLQLSQISPPATEGDGLGHFHADGLAAHQALAQAKVGFELTAAQAMDVGLLDASGKVRCSTVSRGDFTSFQRETLGIHQQKCGGFNMVGERWFQHQLGFINWDFTNKDGRLQPKHNGKMAGSWFLIHRSCWSGLILAWSTEYP